MTRLEIKREQCKIGDHVAIFLYTTNIAEPFEIIIGRLDAIEEEPEAVVDGVRIDLASEGHTSYIRKINLL